MKTNQEILATLPQPWRDQALANSPAAFLFAEARPGVASLPGWVLNDAFYFSESPEGEEYWDAAQEVLFLAYGRR